MWRPQIWQSNRSSSPWRSSRIYYVLWCYLFKGVRETVWWNVFTSSKFAWMDFHGHRMLSTHGFYAKRETMIRKKLLHNCVYHNTRVKNTGAQYIKLHELWHTPCTLEFVVYGLDIDYSYSSLHFEPVPGSGVSFIKSLIFRTGKKSTFIHQVWHEICTTWKCKWNLQLIKGISLSGNWHHPPIIKNQWNNDAILDCNLSYMVLIGYNQDKLNFFSNFCHCQGLYFRDVLVPLNLIWVIKCGWAFYYCQLKRQKINQRLYLAITLQQLVRLTSFNFCCAALDLTYLVLIWDSITELMLSLWTLVG